MAAPQEVSGAADVVTIAAISDDCMCQKPFGGSLGEWAQAELLSPLLAMLHRQQNSAAQQWLFNHQATAILSSSLPCTDLTQH